MKEDASDAQILALLDQAWDKIEALQDQLRRPPPSMSYRQKPRLREEIRSLMFAIGGAPAVPTQSQGARVVQLQEETSEAVRTLERIISNEIQMLNSQIGTLPPIETRAGETVRESNWSSECTGVLSELEF